MEERRWERALSNWSAIAICRSRWLYLAIFWVPQYFNIYRFRFDLKTGVWIHLIKFVTNKT